MTYEPPGPAGQSPWQQPPAGPFHGAPGSQSPYPGQPAEQSAWGAPGHQPTNPGYGQPPAASGYGQPPAAPGYGQPGPVPGFPAPAYGQPVGPAPKSNRTLLVVLASIGAVVVLCCGGATALYVIGSEKTPVASASAAPSVSPVAAPSSVPTTGPKDDTGGSAPDDAGGNVPDDTGTADPKTSNMRIGQTLVLTRKSSGDQMEVTVTKVTTRKTGCAGGQAPDGVYLLATVRVEIVKGTGSVNPLYFRFRGAGAQTNSTIDAMFSGCGQLRSGVDLKAGTKVDGTLVFETRSPKGELVFQQPGDATTSSWKVG